MKTLYLIDGYSYLYRAYYVVPDLTNPAGVNIGAVYGFTKMILKLLQHDKPAYGVVAFDNAEMTLREQRYPFYKANRKEANPQYDVRRDKLRPQFQLAREASRALGFANIEAAGYEADDVIATLAAKAVAAGMEVVIVSPDKDLQQLIGEGVSVFDPMQKKTVTPEDVKAKFGVLPAQLREVLALTGDTADNVPGVPGVGVKKAAALLAEYGNLEGVLANAEKIRQPALRKALMEGLYTARQAYDLIGLYTDAPLYLELEDLKVIFNKETARDFCRVHDFKSLIDKL